MASPINIFSTITLNPSIIFPRRQSNSITFAAVNSPESPPPPEIELKFIGPKKLGSDGSYPIDEVKTISGEKLLRNIMLDNNLELYATYGKLMNCAGGGSCGTCIVEKPESWRLACQTIVGNKENSGKVVVQRVPQWKK
ncbi:PREDICTED: photosynthetic NDH subunit of subcomplex B 3, chloroplastic isoform X2 [Lupinus angustifolius]|uniref:photosynthetic NDH subunit of subcomplex B 3, chloroplastic isoform X2 n=1 Tax=Lupinus angustifolius TaxID=3871 RepID=UPI00092EDF61|nr:PREDICTED: photosynthetic NDH subunit of subcomplex B 3, chloroplastic isoform X2 [Lupinus angustifolius]